MICLFLGENSFEIERQLRALIAEFNGDVERIDGAEIAPNQLSDLLLGTTLFSVERLVILKGASENKPVWDALGERVAKGISSDLILIEPKPDKRTKTYKTLQQHATVIEAQEWTDRERGKAEKWLREYAGERSVSLSSDQITKMITRAMIPSQKPGTFTISQQQLASVLDALSMMDKVTDELIDAVLPGTTNDTVFDILRIAIARDVAELMVHLERLRVSGDAYMTLGFIMSQWSQLVSVATIDRPIDEVAHALSVHPFVLQTLAAESRSLTRQEISTYTYSLAALDARLKTTATDPWDSLTAWLVSIAVR